MNAIRPELPGTVVGSYLNSATPFKEAAHPFDPMRPNGWNSWIECGIEVIEVLGDHNTYYTEPHVRVFAKKLNACLEEVDGVLLSERR